MHRTHSASWMALALAAAGGGCSPSPAPAPKPPPAVTVTAPAPASAEPVASHSSPPQPAAAPKANGCAKPKLDIQEALEECTCDKVGAPANAVCGEGSSNAEPGDVAIEVRVKPDPAANGEMVTAEVVMHNRSSKPRLVMIDFNSRFMHRRFSVQDSQSVRVDRPADDARCQNNFTKDLLVRPPEFMKLVLLPGVEVVERLEWKAERAAWGGPKNHAPAVGIPTCDVVGSSVPLKPGRYTFTIVTGIMSPSGMSEVRGDFAVEK